MISENLFTIGSTTGAGIPTTLESSRVVGIGKGAPLLSIVVIGRNEGQRLVRCLESIRAVAIEGVRPEVFYVDSASTDNSVQSAFQLGATVISAKPERPSAAAGRNLGWQSAKGSFVLFLDGDTILDPDFVENALHEFKDQNVAVVFGDTREISPGDSIYNRILDLDWIVPIGPVEFCGGAALVRREVLETVGGYNERLIAAEDTELCARIRTRGYSILHIDRRMVLHDLAISKFSQYWKRAVRTGYAYAEVSERIQQNALPNWYRQARRNRVQGVAMLTLLGGSPLLAGILQSYVPILAATVIMVMLVIRTAIRGRWRKADLVTSVLHGLHSHLIQIPLLFGQLKFQLDRFEGRRAELIEYKKI